MINNIMISDSLCISTDAKSVATAKYSLTNDTLLPGEGNLKADPMFISSNNYDFRLQKNSPCIDSGDPNSELDPDGTRADMGALYYSQQVPKIVINEINYNSSPDFDSDDWVEFFNNDSYDVDMSNWVFKDSDDSHAFVFPDNTILKRGQYLVLSADTIRFKSVYKNTDVLNNLIGNMTFGFSGAGELLRLFDNYNKLIDFVEYDDVSPWDERADGKGHSLQLINPDYDNTLAINWRASNSTGTPGRINDSFTDTNSEIKSTKFTVSKVFPNPANNYILVEISNYWLNSYNIAITDISGRTYKTAFEILSFDERTSIIQINISNISSGYYILSIKSQFDSKEISFIKF